MGVAQPQILSAGDRLGWLSQPRLRSVVKHSFSWEELFVNHLADSGRSKFLCERMTSSKPNSRSKHELSIVKSTIQLRLYYTLLQFPDLRFSRPKNSKVALASAHLDEANALAMPWRIDRLKFRGCFGGYNIYPLVMTNSLPWYSIDGP